MPQNLFATPGADPSNPPEAHQFMTTGAAAQPRVTAPPYGNMAPPRYVPTPPGHFSNPMENLIAASARLAALPVDGSRELVQTALAQQEAYSYSRDRIHSTPRPHQSPSYSRHMESEALSSNAQHRNQPGGYNPVHDRINQEDQRAAQLAAQQVAHQAFPDHPTTSVELGVATRTGGVPCLIPALRNIRLPKDFKGPRKVPNYTADLQRRAWIESYEMAMELLEASDEAMAKYFTMMLDGTARAWLKGLL